MPTLLFVLGIVCVLIAAHPFITYPWSLIVLQALYPRRSVSPSLAPVDKLSCAICVCAYNEERVIERKMRNLMALREREPELEILIYVDAATDRTAEILSRYKEYVDYLHIALDRHGKTYGMNLLASQAKSSLLIFTDANVTLDIDCVQDFKRYFSDPEIGCVCGNLAYTNDAASVTSTSGSVYWRFEEAIKRLEAETGSVIGADGSVFAIRRALHQPPPDHLIDDMYVSLMILCAGYRVVQAADARAYEESVVAGNEEFRRKIRIACQAFNVHRVLWPRLRQLDRITLYKYVSHKLIRWFTIYLLAIAAMCFEASMIAASHTRVALVITSGLAIAFILGGVFSVKVVAQIMDVLSAFVGTGVGIWRSLRGERYQTWTPAESIRKSG